MVEHRAQGVIGVVVGSGVLYGLADGPNQGAGGVGVSDQGGATGDGITVRLPDLHHAGSAVEP